MNRSLGIGLLLTILVGAALLMALSGAAATPTDGHDGPLALSPEYGSDLAAQSDGDLSLGQSGEVDVERFKLTVHENGTAKWTFQSDRYLEDQAERDQFETFAEEFNSNREHQLFVDFQNQGQTLVANADGEIDREMNARDFEREATIESDSQGNDIGVVTMSFYWDGFAKQQDDRIIVGDIYEGGHYIGENQWIVFEAGEGLSFTEYDPENAQLSGENLTDSETLTWQGEETFTDNRPRVVLQPADAVQDDTTADGDVDGTTNGEDDPLMLLMGIVVLVVGIGTIVAWRRDGSVLDRLPSSEAETATPASPPEESTAAEQSSETTVPDEELLTDEVRVVTLLEENGGRMKQVNIVEETGWSKSKVSMLLSDMADEGDISKLRVGRENIISLDGHEPEAARSPFEDE